MFDMFADRDLTEAQAKALEEALNRTPFPVKTRELPSRKKQTSTKEPKPDSK